MAEALQVPELLEREAALTGLAELFAVATRKSGRMALVSGEAGIGKTSLTDSARVVLGSTASEEGTSAVRDSLRELQALAVRSATEA